MNTLRVRKDFNSNQEYEKYRRDLFLKQILSFLVQLQGTTLLDYNKIIKKGINSTDIVETEQIVIFQRVIVCHEHMKQAWFKGVNREISSSFGSHVFLVDDLIREMKWVENVSSLLFDDAYVAYLIENFGVEHDLSDQHEVFIAYSKAIIYQDKEAQKLWGKKFVQQSVKQAQNDVVFRKTGKAAECS